MKNYSEIVLATFSQRGAFSVCNRALLCNVLYANGVGAHFFHEKSCAESYASEANSCNCAIVQKSAKKVRP